MSLATDTKFTAIRLSSKAACGLPSAGYSEEHPQLNIFTLRLCIQQFNIIYFINYTHIVGKLAIKIFAIEENVSVQFRSCAVDWTLKRRKGAQKSKRRKYVHGNSRQAGVCSHRLRLLVSLAAYAIARSGAGTRGSLAVIAIITCALAGCAVSIKSVGAVIHARLLAVFF